MSRSTSLKVLWAENRGLNILLLVLLLANIAGYLVQNFVLESRLSALQNEVRAQHQELRTLQQQKHAGSMPVSAMTRAESDLARLHEMIPPEEKLSDLIGEVYGFADNSGLEIKQISYSPEWDDDLQLLRYDLKFSVSGQYRQLKRFIHLLERAERILIVSDITMARATGSVADQGVTLQINIKTFFQGQSA